MTHPRFPASNSNNNSCSSRTAVAPGANSNFNHSSSNHERTAPEAAMDNPYCPPEPDNHDIIIEAGVEISVHHNNSTLSPYERTSKSSSHNPKMAICREFVLCALATYCGQRDIGSNPACLDALGGTGIAGIQWKKHLGKKVQVTITDRNPLDLLEANCYRNQLLPKELPIDYTRIPGLPLPHQLVDEIFVQQISANVIMHLEAFDIIFIDAHGSCSTYLDAAFSNVKNNGMVCFVSSDLSALFAKTGHVAVRNYGASVLKNDYMKEAAVRVVTGAAARAAAKCNKGIQVLFGICIEPFVLVVARVQRGPYYADMCSVKIRPLLHCQICEERTFCPDTKAPMENSYDLLPCDCHSKNPGKTAIQLGPMWCDNIFDVKFLESMISTSSEFGFSDKLEAYLCYMYQEAICTSNPLDTSITTIASSSSSSSSSQNEKSQQNPNKSSSSSSSSSNFTSSSSNANTTTTTTTAVTANTTTANTTTANTTTANTTTTASTTTTTNANTTTTITDNSSCQSVKMAENQSSGTGNGPEDMHTSNDAVSVTVVSTSTDTQGNMQMNLKLDKDARQRHHHSSSKDEPPSKKMRFNYSEHNTVLSMPPFFYNIHKRKFKGVFLPKLPKMVHLLQLDGFRASRTMFDTYGVRTNANLKQIYETLLKNCKQETT